MKVEGRLRKGKRSIEEAGTRRDTSDLKAQKEEWRAHSGLGGESTEDSRQKSFV